MGAPHPSAPGHTWVNEISRACCCGSLTKYARAILHCRAGAPSWPCCLILTFAWPFSFPSSQHVSVITTSSYCASCNVSVSNVFNAMRAVIRRDKLWFIRASEGFIWPGTNYACSAAGPCRGRVFRRLYHTFTVMFVLQFVQWWKKGICNIHSNGALLIVHYSYLTSSLSESCIDWVLSLPPNSFPLQVLQVHRGWAGCSAALGRLLQWKLSPRGAVEFRGSVRQGGVRHAGPTAGESPGGAVHRFSKEPACSAVHMHLHPSAAAAVPRQAERFRSQSVSNSGASDKKRATFGLFTL